MGRRIVIEHEVMNVYNVYMEIPAMPSPIKLREKECSSKEEVSQAVSELFDCWTVEYPKKKLEVAKREKENQLRKTTEKAIAGID